GGDDFLIPLHLELDAVLTVPGPAAFQLIGEVFPCGEEKAHGFHLCHRAPGGVPKLLTRLVQGNAVTTVLRRRDFWIDEPFKRTEQGVLLSPAQAGSMWTFTLRLSETFSTSLYTEGYFSLSALESGRFVVLVTKSMRSLSFVVVSTPCSCSFMTSAIRPLCASISFS